MANEETVQIFEAILASAKDTPRQMQFMVDIVVAAQEFMPMPKDGWEQFVRDIEYTNEKHGLKLSTASKNK